MSLLSQLLATPPAVPPKPVAFDMSLRAQIEAASKNARAIAASPSESEKRQERSRRAAQTRVEQGQKQFVATGLSRALLDRLPVGKQNAITRPEIRKLLVDIDYAPNGLSAALLRYIDLGQVGRIGAEGNYRYYRKDEHASQN